MLLKKISFLALTALFALASTLTYAEESRHPIQRLIIFGDSLSDNGNVFKLTMELHEYIDTIPVVPAAELYWNGRFSDGPVWNEFLAGLLHFMPQKRVFDQRDSEHYKNFAYGGAWAETYQPDAMHRANLAGIWHTLPPSLEGQVDDYLEQNKDNPESLKQDLVFVWVGGNDYLNQELTGIPIARSPEVSTHEVLDAIQKSLEKLVHAGATHFVLLGLPDLGRVPNVILRDPQKQTLAPALTELTHRHNEKLQALVHTLSRAYPNATWNYWDANQLFLTEYQEAAARAEHYQQTHTGKYPSTAAPCLLEGNDPDPTKIEFFRHNPILLLSMSTKPVETPTQTYRFCDLHEKQDQASTYNYADAYEAGGIFFDHIHPLTQLHAKIALDLCHRLASLGYVFPTDEQETHYQLPQCARLTTSDLINNIVDAPFPTNEVKFAQK